MSGQLIGAGDDPAIAVGGADPLPTGTVDRGRSVATMAPNRRTEPPIQPIVVRGNDTSAPRVAAIAPSGSAAAPGLSGRAGDVTLNFASADIRDVAQAVLGDMLKLNYVIDPEVTGPITFNVSRPVPRDEVLPTFEAVLNSRGATMTQVNGMIRVMPLQREAKASPGGPTPGRASPAGAVGGSEAFSLRFVSATDMQRLLEKVLPAGQSIVADEKRRMLVVAGSPVELRLAADTVRIFDIDQLSGMSMALLPLQHAEPASVSEELRNIFATTRKEVDNDSIRFLAIDRLNAVMVLSRSTRYLDEARNWVSRLDRTRNLNEKRVYVYNLQYSKAVQVGQKLQGLLSGLDIQFRAPAVSAASGDGVGSATGAAEREAGVKPDARKPGSEPVLASAGPADRLSGNERGARIEADEAHNALLISASSKDYELIRQVLEGIDVPPLQVLIEVTVAEVALNDKLNYGVQYFLNQGNSNTLLTRGTSFLGITPSVPGFALSYVVNGQPRAVLDLLSEVTQTKVISTPRLLVLSNQTARLQVGDVVPIITQSATSTVTSSPLILNNVTYKETGVVLEVTPRVNSGGYVTMDVNQSVSDVVNTTTSQIDSPTIRQRRLTSTISVKTGESILLGGLIQQRDNRASQGIPFLNEIPGVGALFGSRANNAARTELIMLMTPQVVSTDEQSRSLTASIARQFQSVLDQSNMVRPRTLPTR